MCVTLVGGINKTLRVANYIIRLHVAYVGNTYSHIPNDLPEGPIFIFTGEPCTQWAGYCSFTLHRAVNEPRPRPIRSPPKPIARRCFAGSRWPRAAHTGPSRLGALFGGPRGPRTPEGPATGPCCSPTEARGEEMVGCALVRKHHVFVVEIQSTVSE